MPAFWMTVNPSDLRHPLVLMLAGVEYSGDVTIIAIVPQASDHGARPVPVSEWVHLYSISSCTIQPSFLSLVFNHPTSAFDPVLHLRVHARRHLSDYKC